MTTDDFDLVIDPVLESRLRRTMNAVAMTINDDSATCDGIVQSTISAKSVPLANARQERRKKLFRFRPARVAAVVAATAVAAVVITSMALQTESTIPGTQHRAPEAIALGDEALSPSMRDAGNVCLAEARRFGNLGQNDRPNMVNYMEHPWLSIVIYQAGDRLVYCTVNTSPTGEELPFGSVGDLSTDTLLRGPIAPELMETDGVEGEYMAVAGRVSSRVGRVMFDDGAGHTRQAKLANGTFATAGSYLRSDKALLITYDDAGKEIDRRPAFGVSCDPDNQANRELPGTVCEPHERWTPQEAPHKVA